MHRLLIPIYVLTIGLCLLLDAQAQATPQQTKPAVEEEPPPVLSVPPEYRYDPRGRRDPFVNPIPKPVPEEPPVPVIRPPGLKGVLLNEANVIGIVTSKEPTMNVAIIAAPGGRTYFATRRDTLFDALIKEIQVDSVVFTLKPPGQAADAPPRDIVRKVRPTPGENK